MAASAVRAGAPGRAGGAVRRLPVVLPAGRPRVLLLPDVLGHRRVPPLLFPPLVQDQSPVSVRARLHGDASAQKGVLWWAAHHRDHHKYSDTPQDLHSPLQSGLWWSHVGWILSPKYNATNFDRIRDFARFPELRWLNRWYLVPPVVYFTVLGLVGGLPLILWGGVSARSCCGTAPSPSTRWRMCSAPGDTRPATAAGTTGCSR